MIRKDKIHIVLLVCAVILCLAANGSVSSDELGQMHSSLAGTTALADGPPETETDEVSQEVNTAADPAESAEPDNYVPLYINGVLDSECLVIDGIARMSLGRFAVLAGLEYDGHAIDGIMPEVSELDSEFSF